MFINVVLPAPFSPSRPSTSPALSVRSTESQARTAPKLLLIPRMARSSVMGGALMASHIAVDSLAPGTGERAGGRGQRSERKPHLTPALSALKGGEGEYYCDLID